MEPAMRSTEKSRAIRDFVFFVTAICRRLVRRAAREVLEGRLADPAAVQHGRWLRHDVDRFLALVWWRVAVVLAVADLDGLPTSTACRPGETATTSSLRS